LQIGANPSVRRHARSVEPGPPGPGPILTPPPRFRTLDSLLRPRELAGTPAANAPPAASAATSGGRDARREAPLRWRRPAPLHRRALRTRRSHLRCGRTATRVLSLDETTQQRSGGCRDRRLPRLRRARAL